MAKLTKRDIVVSISNQTGMVQHQVFDVVQKTLDKITDSLANNIPVELRNFGVFFADRVAEFAHSESENGHIEAGPRIRWVNAKLQQRIAVSAKAIVKIGEVFFEERKWKHVRARGQRRVRRENRTHPHLLESILEFRTGIHQHAEAFQYCQRRMSFVDMNRGRPDAERLEDAHASHSQHNFLPQALLRIVRVETIRDRSIPRLVAFDVRIH